MTLTLPRTDRPSTPKASVHRARAASVARESKIAVWDVDNVFPSLERTLEHPVEGRVRTLRSPIFLDGERDDADMTAPPALDEHGPALRASFARQKP